jgi:hypothetical protein
MGGPVGTTPLVKKLRLQAGQRMLLLNAPDNFQAEIIAIPPGIEVVSQIDGEFDFVLIFAKQSSYLTEVLPDVVQSLEHDGLFWVAFPKKSSGVETDLSRDLFWEIMLTHGYRAVTQVYIDETWTAMRFRHVDLIKKR